MDTTSTVAGQKRARSDSESGIETPLQLGTTIVFAPSVPPDCRITVFKQEYHVHSLILRIHSAFFRRFWDSPEKSTRPSSPQFRYEYVSVIDDDGEWGLEPLTTAAPLTDEAIARVPRSEELQEAFRKLLCAMYGLPYRIEKLTELRDLEGLADFYFALPIISATLSNALVGSRIFQHVSRSAEDRSWVYFGSEAERVILMALKLRHAPLFRECFIHLVARWAKIKPSSMLVDNLDITGLVDVAYLELQKKLAHAYQMLVMIMLHFGYSQGEDRGRVLKNRPVEENVKFWKNLQHQHQEVPQHMDTDRRTLGQELSQVKSSLLKNNLTFDRTGFGPGEGPYEIAFLCANIKDEDMPWDPSQTDW